MLQSDNKPHYSEFEVLSAKLSSRLKEFRLESGLTQKNIAESAGITEQTYQRFEQGLSNPGNPMNPRMFTIVALAKTFGMSASELLDFSTDLEDKLSQ